MTTFQRFIGMATDECHQEGVAVELVDAATVRVDGLDVSGYFSCSDNLIKVATKSPHWREVFIHEFAHFLQWTNGAQVWFKAESTLFYDWLTGGIELGSKVRERECYITRNLELDCERRAVRLIRKHELPFDLPAYIQRANSYIFAHQLMLETRVWPRRGVHTLSSIYRTMPTELLSARDYNRPSDAYRRAAAPLFTKDTL